MSGRRAAAGGLVLVLAMASAPAAGEDPSAGGSRALLDLPAREAVFRLARCLASAGFEAASRWEEEGTARLEVLSDGAGCRVTVTRHSPLGSEVRWSGEGSCGAVAECVRAARAGAAKGPAEEFLPGAASEAGRFAVCVLARRDGRDIRFSGVVLGARGRVLSTAHDLERVGRLVVRLADGRILRGKVVRRDPERDLTLIALEEPVPGLPLEGRLVERPAPGGAVYAFGCADGTVRPVAARGGLVPRTSAGRPLWEAAMDAAPGASGAPVFDGEGRLVGLVKGRFRGGGKRGYLVPASTVAEFLSGEP